MRILLTAAFVICLFVGGIQFLEQNYLLGAVLLVIGFANGGILIKKYGTKFNPK